MGADPAGNVGRTFAERLSRLIETVYPAGRGPFTDAEIGQAVGVTAQAVKYWRTGQRGDPKLDSVKKLAALFAVPVAYFFDDEVAEKLDAELNLLLALRDHGVREIALRAADLSPKGRAAVAEMVRQVRQLEGLPPDNVTSEPTDMR